jgi:acyl-CoA ligase (AMP-forming) (exosortase A-associated)
MNYLIHHAFLESCDRFPDKIAVIDNSSSLTYCKLLERAGGLAERLHACGIVRGDRVVFMLEHCIDQAVTILGISSSGAVFVPINRVLFPEQVKFILNDSEASVFITSEILHEKLRETLCGCPALKHVVHIEETPKTGAVVRNTGCIENDLAALLYTSGSTGSPKGVMFSHKNLTAGVTIVSEYLGITSSDKLLGVLQLSFDYGLNQLLTMLSSGGTYRFLTYLVPEDIVRVICEESITGLAGVPQTWMFLMRSSLGKKPVPTLRFITNSGGSVPTKVLEFLRESLPSTDIFLMYGLTEAFRSTFLHPSDLPMHPTSMGKAIPDTEILVLREDGTTPCAPHEIGELVHRGPTVTLGYWKRDKDTRRVFRTIPIEGFNGLISERVVFSGDLVKRGEDGFLYFVSRKDSMIKCSGIRVSPTEIEEIVFRSGLVQGVAAVGIPDTLAGQVVVLFAVPLDGNYGAMRDFEHRIEDYCSHYMPNYMIPQHVVPIDTIPKTPHGKTDYPLLQTTALKFREEHESC